jgi:hypothetical protein
MMSPTTKTRTWLKEGKKEGGVSFTAGLSGFVLQARITYTTTSKFYPDHEHH